MTFSSTVSAESILPEEDQSTFYRNHSSSPLNSSNSFSSSSAVKNSTSSSTSSSSKMSFSAPWYIDGLAATLAAVSTCVSTQPLDTVKTRLQVQHIANFTSKYNGAKDAFRQIYAQEGVKAFFRGLPPSLASMITSLGIFFPIYNASRRYISDNFNLSDTSLLNIAPSVAVAEVCMSLVMPPISVVKVRLQTGKTTVGPLATFTTVFREEGLRGLYAGYKSGLLYSSLYVIYFCMYEPAKKYLVEQKGYHVTQIAPFLAAVCMTLSCVICYPHDVMMSRLQYQGNHRQYRGVVDTLRQMVKTEGPGALFKGFNMYASRLVVGNVITFTTYESALALFYKLKGANHDNTLSQQSNKQKTKI